jgi:hypothetical protein
MIPCPVFGDNVISFQHINDMMCMLLSNILDAKMIYHWGTTYHIGDYAMLTLSICKGNPEFCPRLVHHSAPLSVTTSIGDHACVEDQEESNVNVVCLRLRLHSSIRTPDSIFNLLEQGLVRVLEADGHRHFGAVICKMYGSDGIIGGA